MPPVDAVGRFASCQVVERLIPEVVANALLTYWVCRFAKPIRFAIGQGGGRFDRRRRSRRAANSAKITFDLHYRRCVKMGRMYEPFGR